MADPVIGGWGMRARMEPTARPGQVMPESDGFVALLEEAEAGTASPHEAAQPVDEETLSDPEDHPIGPESPVPEAALDIPRRPDLAGPRAAVPPLGFAWMSLSQAPGRATDATPEMQAVGASWPAASTEGVGVGLPTAPSGVAVATGLASDGMADPPMSTAAAAESEDAIRMPAEAPPQRVGSAATAVALVTGQERSATADVHATTVLPTGPSVAEAERRACVAADLNAPAGEVRLSPEARPSGLAQAGLAQKSVADPAMRLESGATAVAVRARPGHGRSGASVAVALPGGSTVTVGDRARLGPTGGELIGDGRLWPLRDRALAAPETGETDGVLLAAPLALRLGEGGQAMAVPSAFAEGPRTARQVARQVAVQPVLRSGGTAELNLAPEELGQLRLRVEIEDGGLRVLIEAARPDTADLMRRHVETLRQELRSEGLGSVSVSIGGGGQERDGGTGRSQNPGPDRGAAWPGLPLPAPDSVPQPPRSRNLVGHLDLRF